MKAASFGIIGLLPDQVSGGVLLRWKAKSEEKRSLFQWIVLNCFFSVLAFSTTTVRKVLKTFTFLYVLLKTYTINATAFWRTSEFHLASNSQGQRYKCLLRICTKEFFSEWFATTSTTEVTQRWVPQPCLSGITRYQLKEVCSPLPYLDFCSQWLNTKGTKKIWWHILSHLL